jgi:hypothetical protein
MFTSDPVDGSRHDAHCIDESSVLVEFPERSQMGGKGYVGKGMYNGAPPQPDEACS